MMTLGAASLRLLSFSSTRKPLFLGIIMSTTTRSGPTCSPADQGWRMPAEWEPHEATWLAWPHNPDDWPGKFEAIPWVYAELVRHLSRSERVHLLVNDGWAERAVRAVLSQADVEQGRVRFHYLPTDRVWTRDYAPIFLTNARGDLAVTDWQFNAWAKYPNWQRDDAVAGEVGRQL